MSGLTVLLVLLAMGTVGFVLGRNKALRSAGGKIRNLHSLPSYYGWNVFAFTVIPALMIMGLWLVAQPVLIERSVVAMIPKSLVPEGGSVSLVVSDVRRIAEGLDLLADTEPDLANLRAQLGEVGVAVGEDIPAEVLAAGQAWQRAAVSGQVAMNALVLVLAAAGFAFAYARTSKEFRARNVVEQVVRGLLILCSLVAILTTVGIVLSMLFESFHFFQQYPAYKFFFSAQWAPNFRGDSDLGILPLIWGTMYISLIALAFSVPVGLFAAIYMSEYATPSVRSVIKPLLEILAGIPTIVYGLFALVTVGPLLRDYFASPLGLGDSGSSVMTAGLVMGVMLIPFVSSLSDDIINAVPQALRDGSYGLGATKSETIRQVVLPAALPGIVGAVLMAASRAIGETMIVVLGAGAAANLSLNPFEAMTTVTVKIVSQLTGDTDFASPETLVAFALGLTLFAVTLALNVLALYIVRKYREQYD